MNYKEVVKLVAEKNSELRADDPRFSGWVRVEGKMDGMLMLLPDAFVERKESFLLIFAEHYGPFVFDTDEHSATKLRRE